MTLKTDLTWVAPDSGATFEIQPIPPLHFEDFYKAWEKGNPKPKPPLVETTVVNSKLMRPDANDPYYQEQIKEWESEKEHAATHFMLSRGIKNDPPDDWKHDELTYFGDPPAWRRKALWVSSLLHTVKDIQGLIEAINSVNNVTEEGIAESKNDSPPKQAE